MQLILCQTNALACILEVKGRESHSPSRCSGGWHMALGRWMQWLGFILHCQLLVWWWHSIRNIDSWLLTSGWQQHQFSDFQVIGAVVYLKAYWLCQSFLQSLWLFCRHLVFFTKYLYAWYTLCGFSFLNWILTDMGSILFQGLFCLFFSYIILFNSHF